MPNVDQAATRKVAFLVVSDRLTAGELADAIAGDPDRATSGAERFPTWELHAVGSGRDDVSLLVEEVVSRVRPLRDTLNALRATDPSLRCLLRIVQYVGDDPVGPGFAIDAEAVALLAGLGAFIDVHQYHVDASSG